MGCYDRYIREAMSEEDAEVQRRLDGPLNCGDLESNLVRKRVREYKSIGELSETEREDWVRRVRQYYG